MDGSLLSQFLAGAGQKPYRKLVEHHIRKQSPSELQRAVLAETFLLPEHLRGLVEGLIDEMNLRFARDKQFWGTATCREAFSKIVRAVNEVLPLGKRPDSEEDVLCSEDQELAFQLFQILTLSFAYSASLQHKQRKFMGIRKGIFG